MLLNMIDRFELVFKSILLHQYHICDIHLLFELKRLVNYSVSIFRSKIGKQFYSNVKRFILLPAAECWAEPQKTTTTKRFSVSPVTNSHTFAYIPNTCELTSNTIARFVRLCVKWRCRFDWQTNHTVFDGSAECTHQAIMSTHMGLHSRDGKIFFKDFRCEQKKKMFVAYVFTITIQHYANRISLSCIWKWKINGSISIRLERVWTVTQCKCIQNGRKSYIARIRRLMMMPGALKFSINYVLFNKHDNYSRVIGSNET